MDKPESIYYFPAFVYFGGYSKSMHKPPFLSATQVDLFHKQGYLVVEGFLPDKDIQLLQKSSRQIVDHFEPASLKIFTTENQIDHMDQYFLESGDKVRCFFEEEAINQNLELSVPKHLAINKIGHAMHDLLPNFRKVAYRPELFSIALSLGLKSPSIAQSQYIFKQPKIGAKVNPHTDSTFIYSQPLSCLGAWMAMEEATTENGCLMAIPGSHTLPLTSRFVRNEKNTGTTFIQLNPMQNNSLKLEDMQAIPVKKGDLVLLHGQLVHASYANRSQQSRHAFVLHLIDLQCQWPYDNWLQRPSHFPFQNMKSVVEQLSSNKI